MTNKEALKELENNLTVDYGHMNIDQVTRLDEAIDTAIDALRQSVDAEYWHAKCQSYETTIVTLTQMIRPKKGEKV